MPIQICPNKYNKHKSRCIIKSTGRRSLYKHTNTSLTYNREEKEQGESCGGEKGRRLRKKANDSYDMADVEHGKYVLSLKKGDFDETNWNREKLTLYSTEILSS